MSADADQDMGAVPAGRRGTHVLLDALPSPLFVRFESVLPNARGYRAGVFALANGLRRDGVLSPADARWLVTANAWFDEAYADPSRVDPTVYDRTTNSGANAWFRSSAVDLLERVQGHLDLLDRHGVAWRRVESDAPGRVLYEDPVQVVVAPPRAT